MKYNIFFPSSGHNIPCHPRFCQDCQPRVFGYCPHSKYIPGYFEPKTVPKSIDWLYDGNPGESERDGQSYYQTFLGSHRYKPSQSRKRIYLCDLDDDLSDDPSRDSKEATHAILQEFVSLYFFGIHKFRTKESSRTFVSCTNSTVQY